MSSSANKLIIEEFCTQRQAEHEAEDHRCDEENRFFEKEVWQMVEEEELQKWKEEEEQKWKKEERKRRLEEAKKKYERQKELATVKLGKRKTTEFEDSGEETEREPEGSNKNKKVSYFFFLYGV
jgi:hypothetical protein